jgi:hypothetical protein
MPILRLFYMTLNFIYKRNPLSFNLVLSKRLINNNLTLVIPISLTLLFNTCKLSFIYSTIYLNYPIITIYKLIILSSFTILISSYKVITLNIIATGTLKSIASLMSYYNLSSKCITKPCAINTMRSANRPCI